MKRSTIGLCISLITVGTCADTFSINSKVTNASKASIVALAQNNQTVQEDQTFDWKPVQCMHTH